MRRLMRFCAFCMFVGAVATTADATVVFEVAGLSAKGVQVSFEADMTIAGDELTIVLTNTSPVDSLNPDDILTSFYFDIIKDGARPTLTYSSALAELFTINQSGPDTPYNGAGLDDIKGLSPGGLAWIFRTMDVAFDPWLGFGIGTVGNNNLTPNNFPGMDGIETGIYIGDDLSTANLKNKLLVKETATFKFTGLAGYAETDIAPLVAFGLGTAPDSVMTPEPATLVILGLGGLLLRKRIA